MPDISISTAITSSLNTSQYGLIADLQTSNSILSNASPTAGSGAAQTNTPTDYTVALSAEGRQLAAAMPSTVLTETKTDLSPLNVASAQQLGEAVLVGTATTQSGRKVTIEQYNPATVAESGVSPQPSASYMVTIDATDQHDQQSFLLTGNTIINEDAHGALHVSAYTPGQETDGNDIIIGLLATPLSGGAGDDTIIVSGDQRGGTIDAGDGNDTVMIAGNVMDGAVSMGDGNDTLQTGAVFGGNISMGDGNDALQAGSVYGGNITMGDGNDTLQATALSGYTGLNVDTGEGNDSIITKTIGGGQVNLTTGKGNDRINAAIIGLADGQVNIDTGSGNDMIDASYISLGSGQVNIDIGDGNDSVHASWIGLAIGGGDSQVNIASGRGNDSVSASWIGTGINGGRSQVNIDTGDGNDSVHSSWIGTGINGGKTQVNIDTGDGNDSVGSSWIGFEAGGSSQVNIDTGSGNDVVRASWIASSFSGSTPVNINMGSGHDYINAGIEGLRLVTQAKREAMRDLVRETPRTKETPKSSPGGDALLATTSGMTIMTGGNANMARRGSNTYRTQSQSDNATTGIAAQIRSGLRIRSS